MHVYAQRDQCHDGHIGVYASLTGLEATDVRPPTFHAPLYSSV